MPSRSFAWARPRGAVVVAVMLAVGAWEVLPASADVLGAVVVTPLSGTNETLFGGVVRGAQCPAGTTDSFFDVVGDDIGVGAPRGMGEIGALGQASREGRGDEAFAGASIANLRTVGAGAFASSGRYVIRLRCERGAATTDTYETVMDYTAGGAGAFTIQAPRPVPVAPTESAPSGAASESPAPAQAGGAVTPPSGGATTLAPGTSATPAPVDTATPVGGLDPASGSGLGAGTPGRLAQTGAAVGQVGWVALTAIGVGGALVLAGRKRRWRLVVGHTPPADAARTRCP